MSPLAIRSATKRVTPGTTLLHSDDADPRASLRRTLGAEVSIDGLLEEPRTSLPKLKEVKELKGVLNDGMSSRTFAVICASITLYLIFACLL